MRKMTAVAALALACVVLLATPALAQRDPFDPLIDPNAGTAVVTDAGTQDSTFTPQEPSTIGSDSLAETGADVSPWLAIAYTLILLGAGALAIARLHRPEPVRVR